ncbi:MAG: T9SS type A sorting domain-containing protein [Bacteroidota bacterium]
MKNQFLFISVLALAFSGRAQTSLTKAFNQPLVTNTYSKEIYDSVGIVPQSIGTNQLWDFSNFTPKSITEVSNYISAVSSPNGSSYTGSNIVESYSQTYMYMKASFTNYELVGIENPDFQLNFSSNSAIQFVWPIGYGYTKNDAFSGTASASGMSGTVSGNMITAAAGTGTLILPGNVVFTGILQVKTRLNAVASFLFGAASANLKATDYTYYDATHKFPLVMVSYLDITGAYTDYEVSIKFNSAVIVGINDLNFDASFNIFPNPANNTVTINLSNENNADCNAEIINSTGRIVRMVKLGNAASLSQNIPISDLPVGVYIMKTYLGDKVSARKLIIE